jgi:hypothetical protein
MLKILMLLLTFGSFLFCNSALCHSSKSMKEIVCTCNILEHESKKVDHHSQIRIMLKLQSF